LITVEIAAPEDAKEIYDIVKAAFATYQEKTGMREKPGAMLESLSDVSKDILKNHVLIAKSGGKILGSARLCLEAEGVYLYRFAVLPACKRMGVGGAILSAAVLYAKEKRKGAISLHTAKNIPEVLAFYEKHGFSEAGVETSRGYPRALLRKKI